MKCLKCYEDNIIQRFYFNTDEDLKTFKRDEELLVWIFDELICDDVDRRIKMTKQLFRTNCDVKRISVENTTAFDEWF